MRKRGLLLVGICILLLSLFLVGEVGTNAQAANLSAETVVSNSLMQTQQLEQEERDACSALSVGRLATADGSTLNAYTCDGTNDYRLIIHPAADHAPGETYVIDYKGVSGNEHTASGEIPEVAHTYQWFDTEVPVANEHQVFFSENTCSSVATLSNSTNAECLMDWHTLVALALQRADTASKAIKVMGELIEEYGLKGSAEDFMVSDPNECWLIEIPANSTMWVAQRIPDNAVCFHANRLRLQEIDFDDPYNFRYSVDADGKPTVVTNAIAKGAYNPQTDGPFNFEKVYSSPSSRNSIGSIRREYIALSLLCPSIDWDPAAISYPTYVVPEIKVTADWIMDVLWKNVYEDTPYSLLDGWAAGPYQTPDRQSTKGVSFERPIATQTQTYLTVGVARKWVPDALGLMWYSNNTSRTGLFVPIYVSATELPDSWWNLEGFSNTATFTWHYQPESTWWQFQLLKTLCNVRYKDMQAEVRRGFPLDVGTTIEGFDAIQAEDRAKQATIETEALALYRTAGRGAMVDYLTDYTYERCENADQAARDMIAHLISRYRNGSPGSAIDDKWLDLFEDELPASYTTITNDAGVKELGYYYDVVFDPNEGAFKPDEEYPELDGIVLGDFLREDGTLAKRVSCFNNGVALPPEPVRSGFTFTGWSNAAEGGSAYDEFDEISDDLTLYAQWDEDPGMLGSPDLEEEAIDTDSGIQTTSLMTQLPLPEEQEEPVDEDDQGGEDHCSSLAVGKDATADGSTLNAYTCDGTNDYRLIIHPAADHAPGEMYQIDYQGVSGNVHTASGEIPEVAHTYQWFDTEVPVANEHQVFFSENTCQSKAALANSTNADCLMDWHTLVALALQRAATASEAIDVMGELVEEYGLKGSAEDFMVSDPIECWLIEVVGNSTIWVAERIPSDAVCYHANRLRLQEIDFDDPDNFRYSPDLVSNAIDKGYYDPDTNGPFNFVKVYDNRRERPYDARREYMALSLLCPSIDWDPAAISYPTYVVPDFEITAEWIEDVLWKNVYEDTDYSLEDGWSAGPYQAPDRQSTTPSTTFERPIATQTQTYLTVGVARDWVPDELGLMWYSNNTSRTGLFVPIYVSATELPDSWWNLEGFSNTAPFTWHYQPESTWWQFQLLKTLCNVRYKDMQAEVRRGYPLDEGTTIEGFDAIQAEDRANQATIEAEAQALYDTEGHEAAVDYLTDYTYERCENADQAARDMIAHLISRYRNGSPSSTIGDEWIELYQDEIPANYTTINTDVKGLGYYYDIAFDPNGGSFDLDEQYAVNSDGFLTKRVSCFNNGVVPPPNPTRRGYSFIGWFDQASGSRYLGLTPITRDLTLTAEYRPRNSGGSNNAGDNGTQPAEDQQPENQLFRDVAETDWCYEAVNYVVENDLMDGVGGNRFNPNGTLTRAMLVTVLYRMAGEPAVSGTNAYSDVDANTWYTKAVIWANENKIITGYGGVNFGPNDPITREQLAAMLMRYAQYKGYDVSKRADLSGYTDGANTASWAMEALQWANAEGLITGKGGSSIDPQGTATRAEIATILMRFLEARAQ